MNRAERIIHSTFVVAAAALAIPVASSTASAQRQPRVAVAAPPAPERPPASARYPGITVTSNPRLHALRLPQYQQRPSSRRFQRSGPAVYYYYPVPGGYPYYPGVGGGVVDANGRPLYIESQTASNGYGYGLGTPDFSGSPYVVIGNGAMVVDFGNGDQRTIPSCAAQSVSRTPDGQPRTIFYRPGPDGAILREGQRGRVIGSPPAGALVCYTTDQYGRMALDWSR